MAAEMERALRNWVAECLDQSIATNAHVGVSVPGACALRVSAVARW